MGEWDFENYMGYIVVLLVNFYDFVRDFDVKLLVKVVLDWVVMNFVLKYWCGNYCGFFWWDYNYFYLFGGSVVMIVWMWFGFLLVFFIFFESDEVELIISNYWLLVVVVEFV